MFTSAQAGTAVGGIGSCSGTPLPPGFSGVINQNIFDILTLVIKYAAPPVPIGIQLIPTLRF